MTYQNAFQSQDYRFAHLKNHKRIWAIPSIHGQLDELRRIHDHIFREFVPGDRLIYMGNYTGYSYQSAITVDEILAFRRNLMTIQGVLPQDIVYLRGGQEEMMQKIMQIQFAPNPRVIIEWMLENGLSQTLEAYGVCIETLRRTAGSGAVALSRWTNYLRSCIRRFPGHDIFAQNLHRAAICGSIPINHTALGIDQNSHSDPAATPLSLYVSGGIDFNKTLEQQGDVLWWGKDDFTSRLDPYDPFAKVFRGYDPQHKGLHLNCVTATLDNNSGFNGGLICAKIAQDASIADIYQA